MAFMSKCYIVEKKKKVQKPHDCRLLLGTYILFFSGYANLDQCIDEYTMEAAETGFSAIHVFALESQTFGSSILLQIINPHFTDMKTEFSFFMFFSSCTLRGGE